jgi:hypothetical protein
MDTPKHIHLPWRAEERPGHFSILDVNSDLIAERLLTGNIDMDNAQFIVTAVNSHAELLAAAKAVTGLPLWDEDGFDVRIAKAYAILNAAISKAEGAPS